MNFQEKKKVMHKYYLRQTPPPFAFYRQKIPTLHPIYLLCYLRVPTICSTTSAVVADPIPLLEQQHTCLTTLCSALPADKPLTESLRNRTIFTHIASEEAFSQIPYPLPSLSYHWFYWCTLIADQLPLSLLKIVGVVLLVSWLWVREKEINP